MEHNYLYQCLLGPFFNIVTNMILLDKSVYSLIPRCQLVPIFWYEYSLIIIVYYWYNYHFALSKLFCMSVLITLHILQISIFLIICFAHLGVFLRKFSEIHKLLNDIGKADSKIFFVGSFPLSWPTSPEQQRTDTITVAADDHHSRSSNGSSP